MIVKLKDAIEIEFVAGIFFINGRKLYNNNCSVDPIFL